MATAFLYDEIFLKHDAGRFHPESPERLRSILRGLKEHNLWERLAHIPCEKATEEEICLVHTQAHYRFIRRCSEERSVQLDPDTHVSADSFEAAVVAAGAAVRSVRGIMAEEFDNAFAAVRPPGHHATADRAMGFCLFNNIAIAARYLVQHLHASPVLIVDWDVHHGNGTQDMFEQDPDVIYLSLHRKHHYPGTGWENERGTGRGEGTIINVPIGPPFHPARYLELFAAALEKAEQFKPKFVLISCGFDAHERDPLGNLGLKDETYAELTGAVKQFAAKFGHQRIFSILEGGYDHNALTNASAAHVGALLES